MRKKEQNMIDHGYRILKIKVKCIRGHDKDGVYSAYINPGQEYDVYYAKDNKYVIYSGIGTPGEWYVGTYDSDWFVPTLSDLIEEKLNELLK